MYVCVCVCACMRVRDRDKGPIQGCRMYTEGGGGGGGGALGSHPQLLSSPEVKIVHFVINTGNPSCSCIPFNDILPQYFYFYFYI